MKKMYSTFLEHLILEISSNQYLCPFHSHKAGKKVYAWTVDDIDSMQKMLFEGVDNIITSQPHLLQLVMEDIKSQCMEDGSF